MAIKREESYIEHYLDRGNTFLPDKGCPGPAVTNLTDNLVFIAIDNARAGSVIVFHDSEKALKKLYYTLPKVLEHFSHLGYAFKA